MRIRKRSTIDNFSSDRTVHPTQLPNVDNEFNKRDRRPSSPAGETRRKQHRSTNFMQKLIHGAFIYMFMLALYWNKYFPLKTSTNLTRFSRRTNWRFSSKNGTLLPHHIGAAAAILTSGLASECVSKSSAGDCGQELLVLPPQSTPRVGSHGWTTEPLARTGEEEGGAAGLHERESLAGAPWRIRAREARDGEEEGIATASGGGGGRCGGASSLPSHEADVWAPQRHGPPVS